MDNETRKYTVVVVDDHNLLSEAIGGLVQDFNDFEVIQLCKNGKDLLDYLENSGNAPNLVLMDIKMPIMNGVETTEVLREKYPSIRVLALSIEEDENTILQMLRAGARGYLLKDIKKEILEKALLQVMEKGHYYTNTISQLLAESLGKETVELKDREMEFIKLACTEMTYKEIAEIMCLSPKTVEGYRDQLYQRLQIKNRMGLMLYAIRNNYFTP